MTKLIALLPALLAIVEGWQRRRLNERRQREADKLAGDPVRFFNEHFGGLPTDDAAEADNADDNSRVE